MGFNALQHTTRHWKTLHYTATHCNTLQHTATHCKTPHLTAPLRNTMQHTATHCVTLHHIAPHCTTLHHTTPHCPTLHYIDTHCTTLQHTATLRTTLQHPATHVYRTSRNFFINLPNSGSLELAYRWNSANISRKVSFIAILLMTCSVVLNLEKVSLCAKLLPLWRRNDQILSNEYIYVYLLLYRFDVWEFLDFWEFRIFIFENLDGKGVGIVEFLKSQEDVEFLKSQLATKLTSQCMTMHIDDTANFWRMSCLPMGWLRLVGSLKLQVSFAEYSLFYRALLQKRPTIWRSLLIVATPYQIAASIPLLNCCVLPNRCVKWLLSAKMTWTHFWELLSTGAERGRGVIVYLPDWHKGTLSWYLSMHHMCYGVATISRLLKIIGLFCRISALLQGSFAKETYNFKEPTNRSHPIPR